MESHSTVSEKKRRSAQSVPAYRRIEEDIRAKVGDGRLPAGTMLAGRHALAREYGVALSTLQQAISNLIADGSLETSDRRGTFVAQRQVSRGQGDPMPDALGGSGSERLGERTVATLGIVATALINTTASPDVGSLWARQAIRSLEQVFSAAGGTTRYFDRYPENRGPYPKGLDDANAISIPQAITSLLAAGADAIAVVGLCDAADMSDEVVRAVDVERIPTVYISWHEVQPPLAQVYYDNRFAGYQAAQHLLRQGYRSLVFLVPFDDPWLNERLQGGRNAVQHGRLPLETLRLWCAEPMPIGYDRQSVITSVQALAQDGFRGDWSVRGSGTDGPRGIIAPNDDAAYAVLEVAGGLGLSAGVDFGLVGFDDDPRACSVGLTTVRPPVEAMGEEAGRLLLRALQGDKKGQLVRLRSHLIPRPSTSLRSRS